MTVLERAVLFVLTALTVSGISTLSYLTLDTRQTSATTAATLDIRVKALEARGDSAPELAGIKAQLEGLTREVGAMRVDVHELKGQRR